MLFITVPSGEAEGTCRINGEVVEFKVEAGVFAYRPEGGEWVRRTIIQAVPAGRGLTAYVADAGDADGDARAFVFA